MTRIWCMTSRAWCFSLCSSSANHSRTGVSAPPRPSRRAIPGSCPEGVFEYQLRRRRRPRSSRSPRDSTSGCRSISSRSSRRSGEARGVHDARDGDPSKGRPSFETPEGDTRPCRTLRELPHIASGTSVESQGEDAHPFCPCCLLTNTAAAFRLLSEGDGFHGLRLFAAQDQNGRPQVDCRVNGEDWEQGAKGAPQIYQDVARGRLRVSQAVRHLAGPAAAVLIDWQTPISLRADGRNEDERRL